MLQPRIQNGGGAANGRLTHVMPAVQPRKHDGGGDANGQLTRVYPRCSRANMMAVELVTEHLKVKLRQHPLVRQYPNLDCMESSSIIRQLHTIIRDKDTTRADFVFYADRLIRLVVEAGLGYLPFGERCAFVLVGELPLQPWHKRCALAMLRAVVAASA